MLTRAEIDYLRSVAEGRGRSLTQTLVDAVRTLTALDIADVIRLRAEASSRRRVKADADNVLFITLDAMPAGDLPDDDPPVIVTYSINDYERAIRKAAEAIASRPEGFTPPDDVLFIVPDNVHPARRIAKFGQLVAVTTDPNASTVSPTSERQS